MDKKQFKNHFITNFLSTWCAKNYNKFCERGEPHMLYSPPLEDAEDIAEEVWGKIQELSVKRYFLEQEQK
jgi:hypothetical protein